jgi:hypothetical protein
MTGIRTIYIGIGTIYWEACGRRAMFPLCDSRIGRSAALDFETCLFPWV